MRKLMSPEELERYYRQQDYYDPDSFRRFIIVIVAFVIIAGLTLLFIFL